MTTTSAATLLTPSDLDEGAAMTVADALKIILANSYAIYLKTKNFHWHVSGPYFRDYHLLLDEQAAEILAVTDSIAERAKAVADKAMDNATSGLIDAWTDEAERRAWFLFEMSR